MATIEINKKENNEISAYTPCVETSNIKPDYVYDNISKLFVTNDLEKNMTTYIQMLANQVVSPDAAYWEEILLPNMPNDIDMSKASICNVDEFFVIFCPYNDNNDNHYMYSWNSRDGGYTWYQHSFNNNNVSTQINTIFKTIIVKTAMAYRVIIIGNNGNGVSNIYTALFSYLKTDGISYYLMQLSDGQSFRYTGISNPIVKTPRGFFLLTKNGDIYFSPYTYDYNTANNGIDITVTSTFYFYLYSTYFESAEMTGLFYDELFDRFIVTDEDNLYVLKLPYTIEEGCEVNIADMLSYSKCINAFEHCVFYDNYPSDIYYINFPAQWDNNGLPIFENATNIELELSSDSISLVGNKYRLYDIKENGEVYYRQNLVDNWISSNQDADTTNLTFVSLQSIIGNETIIRGNFVGDENNTDIVGIIRLSNSSYKVIHTHTGNIG